MHVDLCLSFGQMRLPSPLFTSKVASFLAGRTFIVVVVPAGCRGSPIAFLVRTYSRDRLVTNYEYELPAHVAELLPANCVIDPPR